MGFAGTRKVYLHYPVPLFTVAAQLLASSSDYLISNRMLLLSSLFVCFSVDFFSPVDRICEAGLLNRKEGALESNGSWVSSMRVDPAGNWLSCGGGSTALPNSNTVGWVGLWHLPSRSVTSASVLPAATQAMVFSDDSLITVGNEPFLSYFKWEALQLRTRVKTTSRSCFALAVNKHSKYKGVTAVGGCSPCIDVYTYPGTQAFALTAQ